MSVKRFTEAIDKRLLDPVLAVGRWIREALPGPLFEAAVALAVGYVVARLMLQNVMFGVGLVTGVLALLVLMRKPHLVVYVALGLVPLHWVRLLGDRVRLISFLALLAFLYYLFNSMVDRRRLNERVFWLYSGFLLVCVVSMTKSGAWYTGYHYMRMYLFALLFGFAFVMAIDGVGKMRIAMGIVIATGLAASLLGLLQSLVSIKFFPGYYIESFGLGVVEAYAVSGIYRASGTFESGPRYAMFLLLPMSLALAYFFDARSRRRTLWLAILILNGLAVLVSFTRAAYVMVFLMFVIYFASERRKELAYKAIFITLLVGILFAFIVVFFVPSEVNEAVSARLRFETGGTYKDRIYFWYNAFMAFLENPFMGIGLGMYNARSWEFMQRFVVPWDSLRWEVSPLEMPQWVPVHNAYLRIMTETGVLGILFYIAIFVATFKDLTSVIRNAADPWLYTTARGIMLFMYIMMVYWFFHEYIFDEAYVSILPIAFAPALRRINDNLLEQRARGAPP